MGRVKNQPTKSESKSPLGELCAVELAGNSSQHSHDHIEDGVPKLRDLGVDLHHLGVDIVLLGNNSPLPVTPDILAAEAEDMRAAYSQGNEGGHEAKSVNGCHVSLWFGIEESLVDSLVIVQNSFNVEAGTVLEEQSGVQRPAHSLDAQGVVHSQDGKNNPVVENNSTEGTKLSG